MNTEQYMNDPQVVRELDQWHLEQAMTYVDKSELGQLSPNTPGKSEGPPETPYKGKTPDELLREAKYAGKALEANGVTPGDSATRSRFDDYSRTVRKEHEKGRER